jgi:hypothetical protein
LNTSIVFIVKNNPTTVPVVIKEFYAKAGASKEAEKMLSSC